jgi:RimJ/RimL family protein N-acetyltransferase
MTQPEQNQFTSLETDRLILRGLRDEDLPEFLNYLNDPEVAKYQTWESYSESHAVDVINDQKQIHPGIPGRPFTFGAEVKSTGVFIGHVVLTIQEKDHKQAEIGFTFARSHHRQGYGKEAAMRVLGFAFEEMSLHRVFAITDCENLPSVALLSSLGMRREGHYIQNIWFKGKWGDEYQYAILQSEWLDRARVG